MKIANILFYSFITVLALLTIFYAKKWFSSDSSGEAGFAVIAGAIIPVSFAIKNFILKYFSNSNKDNLEINITKKNIRCYKRDVDYAIHLEIELFANTKISIKKLKLSLQEPCGWSNKFRDISTLPKLVGRKNDLLKLEPKLLMPFISECKKISALPIVINESEHLIFTISGEIKGERLQDGWEGLMLSGWEFVIEYNDNKLLSQQFTVEPHERTLKEPSEYRVVGFTNA
tara:strand:+ start:471 stop:1160 length:690 start_codon:yes stop_codon:yes gene_type:complete